MIRFAFLLPLMLAFAACAPTVTAPDEPAPIRYQEPVDVAFPTVVEAAEAARLGDDYALPVIESDAERGLVQLQGDPLDEGEEQTVTIVVLSDPEGGSTVLVSGGASGPTGTALAEEYEQAVIAEIDSRLTRVGD